MRTAFRSFMPVLILFIMLNSFFILGKSLLAKWNTDYLVLLIGNLLIFFITYVSFFLSLRGLKNTNPNVFVRSVFGGIMIKMFLCIIVAFAYIASLGKELNKPALFTCMGLYLVYTFLEVGALTRILRQKSNG